MKMGRYKIPAVRTYSASEIVEIIGPVQVASLDVERWRGTKLEQPTMHEYRLAENQSGIKIVQIDTKGGIKNA